MWVTETWEWESFGEKSPARKHIKNPTSDDPTWKRARRYYLSRNQYLHKSSRNYWLPQQNELLGKPDWVWANSVIPGGKGEWGEEKQKWGPALQGACRLHRIRDLQSCGGKWDTVEFSGDTEMTTSALEHETRCEDKWNDLLSMSRVNRTKAISDVERLEIRKTKQQAVKRRCRNTAVEICEDKLHKHLSGMTNV